RSPGSGLFANVLCDAHSLRARRLVRKESQHLADGPRLKRTPAGCPWLFTIRHLRDVANPRLVQMPRQPRQESTFRFATRCFHGPWATTSRATSHPRVDERTHEPRPCRSIVIGTITRRRRAGALRDIPWVVGRERPQP